MFLNLLFSYLEAMNSNKVPEILTSLETIMQQEARKIRDNLQQEYFKKLEN